MSALVTKPVLVPKNRFLGAFAKFRKTTISFVMSLRLSVCPHGTIRLQRDVFWWNLIFKAYFDEIWYLRGFFSKTCGENSTFIKMLQKYRDTSHKNVFTFTRISRWVLRMRNSLDKSCRENQNTHFMFNNLFPKNAQFMRQCRKIWCNQRSHKWRHNMAHTCCMLDKQGYTFACACTRPSSRAPIRAHPACAHTNMYCL